MWRFGAKSTGVCLTWRKGCNTHFQVLQKDKKSDVVNQFWVQQIERSVAKEPVQRWSVKELDILQRKVCMLLLRLIENDCKPVHKRRIWHLICLESSLADRPSCAKLDKIGQYKAQESNQWNIFVDSPSLRVRGRRHRYDSWMVYDLILGFRSSSREEKHLSRQNNPEHYKVMRTILSATA